MSSHLLARLTRSDGTGAMVRLVILGFVIATAAEVALRLSGTDRVYGMEACYAAWLIILPAASVAMSRSWRSTHLALLQLLGVRGQRRQQLVDTWQIRIFESGKAVACSLALLVVGIASIVWMGTAYDQWVASVTALLVFGIVLMTAGLFAWSSVAYIGFLRQVARLILPSGRPQLILATQHPVFADFERFWIRVSALTSLGFLLIAGSTQASPYADMPLARFWIVVAATAPVLVVGVALIAISQIRTKVRDREAAAVLSLVGTSWNELGQHTASADTIEKLTSVASLAETVGHQPSAPSTVRAIGGVALALLPLAVAIYDAISTP